MPTLSDAVHLMRAEKYSEAIKAFEQVYQETGRILAKTNIVAIYCLQKKHHLARVILENLPTPRGKVNATEVLLGWALYYHHLEEFTKEQEYLDKVSAGVDSLINTFHYFMKTKQTEKAALQLNIIKANDEARPEIIEELESIITTDHTKKFSLIRKLIDQPSNINMDRIFSGIKDCIINLPTVPQEEYKKIRNEIEACIKEFAIAYPTDSSPPLIKAFLFEYEGKFDKEKRDEAERIYKDALVKYPRDYLVSYKAANFISRKLSQHDKAEKILLAYLVERKKGKIEISARSEASIYNSLAIINSCKAEQTVDPTLKSKVKEYAKKAIATDEKYAAAHATLAHYYHGVKQKEKALAEFNRAFELNPKRFQRNHGKFAALFQLGNEMPKDKPPLPWLQRKKIKLKEQIEKPDADGFITVHNKKKKILKTTALMQQTFSQSAEELSPAKVASHPMQSTRENRYHALKNQTASLKKQSTPALEPHALQANPEKAASKHKRKPIKQPEIIVKPLTDRMLDTAAYYVEPVCNGIDSLIKKSINFYHNNSAERMLQKSVAAGVKSGTLFFKAAYHNMPTLGNDIYQAMDHAEPQPSGRKKR